MRKAFIILFSVSGIVGINVLSFIITTRLSGNYLEIIKLIPGLVASTISSSIALIIALMNLIKNPRVEWDLCPSLVSWDIELEINVSNLNDRKLHIASFHSKYFMWNRLAGKDEVRPYKATSVKYVLSPIDKQSTHGSHIPVADKKIKIYVVYYFEGSSRRRKQMFIINNPYII